MMPDNVPTQPLLRSFFIHESENVIEGRTNSAHTTDVTHTHTQHHFQYNNRLHQYIFGYKYARLYRNKFMCADLRRHSFVFQLLDNTNTTYIWYVFCISALQLNLNEIIVN